MTTLEELAAAHRQFDGVLAQVTPAHWTLATPCEGWSVDDLVGHVVNGERMTVLLLEGATRDEALAAFGGAPIAPDEALGAYREAASAVELAFQAPGALDRTVHHMVGDISGAQLLGFRVGDVTLHSWDLARAAGLDETLDPVLVDSVWSQLEPMSAIISSIGVFGEGPSGTVGEDADLQIRLLDLSGRRP